MITHSRATTRPRPLLSGAALAAALVGIGLSAATTPAVAASAPSPKPPPEPGRAVVEQAGPVPGGFASWEDLLAVQQRLVTAADRLTAASTTRGSGFAGITVAPERRRLDLFWKGTPPAGVQTLLTEVRRGVAVQIHPARHSAAELSVEARRLTRTVTPTRVTSLTAAADGSGLTATVQAPSVRTSRALDAATRVPLTVKTGARPVFASRWNDSPRWYGGAAWKNANTGGGCSTGFAVRHQGRTKMLTAGHCGSVGHLAKDPAGEKMGYITQDSNPYDVQLIDARSAGRIFANDANLNEFTYGVSGATGSYTGMYICTSGAYSGLRCGVQVKDTGVNIDVGPYWILNTVMAEKIDRTNAIGQGDSGGPVIRRTLTSLSPLRSTTYAAGVNSAIDRSTATACTGYVKVGRLCAWRMYYAPTSSVGVLGPWSPVLG